MKNPAKITKYYLITMIVVAVLIYPISLAMGSSITTTVGSSPSQVWHWYGQCYASRKINLRVFLNHQVIYNVVFPICRSETNVASKRGMRKKFSFHFRVDTKIFGKEFAALGVKNVEGDVWQAGKDPRLIVLGISFMTKSYVLLNSIHLVWPDRISKTNLAEGLILETHPVAHD